jgi:hypothetical protein
LTRPRVVHFHLTGDKIITITGKSYRLKDKAACREGAKADNRTGSK